MDKLKSSTSSNLEKINLPTSFYGFLSIIVFLIIIIFVLIYNKNPKNPLSSNKPKSHQSTTRDVFIIFTFVSIILILCFVFLPNFKDLLSLFNQIQNVSFVVLYTIFLILLFLLLPSSILNNSSYSLFIIIPNLLITCFLFYNSLSSNYLKDFNIGYERIKMIVLFFCFITICITYYSKDPGGYIKKYFGISGILSIILGVFGLLYLIVLFTLPGVNQQTNNTPNITPFSLYGSISFIIFLIIITIVIATYPGGFFNTENKNAIRNYIAFIFILIVSILWSILLISNMFSNSFSGTVSKENMESKLSLFKKALLVLFGITISGIIIAFIVYNIQHFSGKSSIPSLILNVILVLCVLTLIYKVVFVRLPSDRINKGKNSFFDLIINVILYIPCLFYGIIDGIMKTFMNEYNQNSRGTYFVLIFVIVTLALYLYVIPSIQTKINLQNGKLLLENPINTNKLYTLANYEKLNDNNTNFDYQYAISFWVFIDSSPPNTNSNYTKYTSLLNYGGKPNILYKADTNSLMITMSLADQIHKQSPNKLFEYDDEGNRIIYTNNKFLLQKWNNIIINYNGGTLDVFLNGELVKSSIEVIPYMKYDVLTCGTNGGVNGGITNVIYFKNPLTMSNIYYVYNTKIVL